MTRMKKCVNGQYIELTDEEIEQIKAEQKRYIALERRRPKTYEEGMLELNKALLKQQLETTEDKTLAIACMAFFEPWTKGKYEVGDVRTDPATGYPYECITAHDSSVNTTWDISVRTLWKPYHSTKKEYALPWEAPTGAHDIYKAGEYMVFADDEIYSCLQDTNFSPTDYPSAWKLEE